MKNDTLSTVVQMRYHQSAQKFCYRLKSNFDLWSSQAKSRRVRIGISPLAGNAVVSIDPDRLFGRHLAVLGNTGSGKSCSVAGLIRWSLEAARLKLKDTAKDKPNARFIILDPNREYSRAFGSADSDLQARIFKVSPEVGELALHVPLWFWNSAEWVSFTQASAKTQKPTLVQALRFLRDQQSGPAESLNHGCVVFSELWSRPLGLRKILEARGYLFRNRNPFLKSLKNGSEVLNRNSLA